MSDPRVLGLSGGIGAGKSYVADILRRFGVPIFDCDRVGREAYLDTRLRNQIEGLLGKEVYDTGTGSPLYGRIAERVFSNEKLLRSLEHLIHPYVLDRFIHWRTIQEGPLGWVGLESAILWRARFDRYCDAVLEVTAPLSIRMDRVQKRDGLTPAQVKARMDHQQEYTIDVLRALCLDRPLWVIDNDGKLRIEHSLEKLVAELAAWEGVSSVKLNDA